MAKKGYIICDGTLYHAQQAQVELIHVRFSDRSEKELLLVKTGSQFVLLHDWLKRNEIPYKPHANQCMREADGYFGLSFDIEAKHIQFIEESINMEYTYSRFYTSE